jgi:hypothetical protein
MNLVKIKLKVIREFRALKNNLVIFFNKIVYNTCDSIKLCYLSN